MFCTETYMFLSSFAIRMEEFGALVSQQVHSTKFGEQLEQKGQQQLRASTLMVSEGSLYLSDTFYLAKCTLMVPNVHVMHKF